MIGIRKRGGLRRSVARAVILWLMIVGLSVGAPTGRPIRSADPEVVLVGGTLIDGNGGAPLQDAVIVIQDNKILRVGKRGKIEYPKSAKVIDVADKFILPGLIDLHVHYFDWMGELFLAHGVTTVKDVGNAIEWISTLSREIEQGKVRGPRIVYVGYGLDTPPPAKDSHVGVDTPDMARRAVALQYGLGASGVKVREKMTAEVLRAITQEAHRLGMTVTGHIGRIDAREAALAGIDGLEHASGIIKATASKPIPEPSGENELQKYISELKAYALIDSAKAADLVKFLAEKNVALIPTMSNWWRMPSKRRNDFAREDAEYAKIPELAYVPQHVRQIWATSFLFNVKNPDDLAELEAAHKKVETLLRQHYQAGGKVLAGSDTFISIPGLSLHREIALLVDAGLTPMQAIMAATRDNAQFLGKGKELGTVEPGKLADLLVVNADPLKDVRNTQQVAMVMKGGQVVDTSYHADYSVPFPKPDMTRPNWLERGLRLK